MNIKLNSYSKRDVESLKRIWDYVLVDDFSKKLFGNNQHQGIPKFIFQDTNSDLISNHVNTKAKRKVEARMKRSLENYKSFLSNLS
ncbi:hypothetical protein [Leptospira santarosai]|uniref:hypothetical protein n=1 Tax=Leptospira santarosai TaxID=28183 RepID=UPI0002983B39|nr:hypothetical protein [Leptospira santarosai]EKS08722.1 hypothetical protein LEP1GSC071_4162 [Leptospira santarosai str. JET]KXZ28324.1 hypothetical protein AYB33_17890 [Leptospira santarosai]